MLGTSALGDWEDASCLEFCLAINTEGLISLPWWVFCSKVHLLLWWCLACWAYPWFLLRDTIQIKVDPISQLALRADTRIIDTRVSERFTSHAVQDECQNISGPLIIRTLAWFQNPLSKYYRYIAHHKGDFIRMVYIESCGGPWWNINLDLRLK